METLITDWLSAIVRWFHVIAGIAWIGSSFFFIFLDASLRKESWQQEGIAGESWLVHGGGFYKVEKYMVAPARMPAVLHWFKWEAYSTWLSGFALLVLLYYVSAGVYLIDPAVAALTPMTATVIGIGSLVFGWIVYDLMCRALREHNDWLAIGGGLVLAAVAVGYTKVFGGRGAFIHTGALIGTLMVANVFMVIIPNQRKVVADLIAGRKPDPALGKQAKQRSVHNNYLTLPVLFMMVSNHYPMVTGHPYNWALLIAIGITGGVIRHWFNVKHLTGRRLDWLWAVAAVLVAGMFAFSAWRPDRVAVDDPQELVLADVFAVAQQRCTACHSANPTDPNFQVAPAGMMFDTAAQFYAARDKVFSQVSTGVMPPGNLTGLTETERATIVGWYEAGARQD
ncbi:MAG: urate hydroxylase PuuD [Alphaproteobacteria bacterium]